MTKRNSAIILCSCLLAAILISCTQQRDPCLQPRTMSLSMGAYRISDTSTLDTALLAPLVAAIDFNDSIKVTAYGAKDKSKFTIYMSPQADSCRWMILPDTSASIETADTLTFYYDKSLQFLSNACGYAYFYNLHSVRTTNHSIDSVVISNYNINTDVNKEHLKIYY